MALGSLMLGLASSGYAPRQEATKSLHTPRHDLLFGITRTGVVHLVGDNPEVDTRLAMVRDAGVFDYFDCTPPTGENEMWSEPLARSQTVARAVREAAACASRRHSRWA